MRGQEREGRGGEGDRRGRGEEVRGQEREGTGGEGTGEGGERR